MSALPWMLQLWGAILRPVAGDQLSHPGYWHRTVSLVSCQLVRKECFSSSIGPTSMSGNEKLVIT